MKPARTSAPKGKVILTWILMLLILFVMFAFWYWWAGREQPKSAASEEHGVVYSIVMAIFGLFFLAAGIAAYFLALFTNLLTFNFSAPVWGEFKVKLYFANIFIPLAIALGVGFILSAFLSPAL